MAGRNSCSVLHPCESGAVALWLPSCWTTAQQALLCRMDWTDVHYRQLARLISKRTWLYTEMVVDNTLIHQLNRDRWLWFPPEQRPHRVPAGWQQPGQPGQGCSHRGAVWVRKVLWQLAATLWVSMLKGECCRYDEINLKLWLPQ